MTPVFCTMLDTVRIVTFQPTAASKEAERIALERQIRRAEAAIATEMVPAAARAATRESGRLRGWFSFSFMAR